MAASYAAVRGRELTNLLQCASGRELVALGFSSRRQHRRRTATEAHSCLCCAATPFNPHDRTELRDPLSEDQDVVVDWTSFSDCHRERWQTVESSAHAITLILYPPSIWMNRCVAGKR